MTKSSFKTTTLIAAIGMMVYTLYVLTRYTLSECCGIHYVFDLATEIRIRLIYDILPLSFIIAGIGLWKYRPSDAASKSFRIFTICLFVALIGTLVFSPLYTTIRIAGAPYILPSIYWRAIMLISGIVWLFMLMRQPLEEASPRSYRVTLLLEMLLLALPVILESISGFALLCGREVVLGFSSAAVKSWVKFIAPILPLIHFVFPQIKKINYMRNTHCTPGSYEMRTFNRNRTITLIVAGVAVLFLCLGLGCLYFDWRVFYRQNHMLDQMAFLGMCISLIAFIVSWVVLSIMAFRQLPNPKGYKIYNIACQIITWGSLFVSFFAPTGIDEVFGVVFLISFGAFFITTTIRVISYSLPKK